MPNKDIYYCATAVIKNTTSLQSIKSDNTWPRLLSTRNTKGASLICWCHKSLKLKWASCFVNTLTSGHLVWEHLSALIHFQTCLCSRSILWAGIRSCWLEIPALPQRLFPCGLDLSEATWECEETRRRPHTEGMQVSHISYTHARRLGEIGGDWRRFWWGEAVKEVWVFGLDGLGEWTNWHLSC